MTFTISPANYERDATTLKRMQEICLPGDRPLPPGLRWWWIARHNGNPAGFCALEWSDVDTGYLARAGVLPEYRGQGLQKRLIKVREAKARKEHMPALVSDTCNAPASANSLIACGFRMFQPSDPWGLPKSVYWRKILH